jgi:alpha-beta hydrolase superfamily lysophospholipase
MAEAEPWDFGRSVRGYVWRAQTARANLLLAHGFAEYSERYVAHYHAVVPRLVALGFDVHAFDLAGHGRSAGARGVTDMHAAVADYRGARAKLADKPLFLFGHSLGGLLTAVSVIQDQGGVAGVVLSAPALLLTAPAHLKAVAGIVSVLAPSARLVPPLNPDDLTRIAEEAQAYRDDPMISDTRVPARTGATALAISETGWRRYSDWKVPTLVLHGEQDRATNPEGSKRFAAMIASSDKRLVLYPDGRHELLNDLDRDAVMEEILSWLMERAPQK